MYAALLVTVLLVAVGLLGTSEGALTSTGASAGTQLNLASVPDATGVTASRPCTAPSAPAVRGVTTDYASFTGTTITSPAVQPNDLLVAFVTVHGTLNNTLTAPAGWTQLGVHDSGLYNRTGVFWRIAPASPAASYTFNWGDDQGAVVLASYSGVDVANPITSSNWQTGSSHTAVAPAVSAVRAPARLVVGIAIDGTDSLSVPTGMTLRGDETTGVFSASRLDVWDEQRNVTGTTGSRSSSVGATVFNTAAYVGWSLLVSAPVANPTVTLSWTPPANTVVTGYQLVRTGGTGATIDLSGRTTNGYTDNGTTATSALTYTLTSTSATAWTSTGVSVNAAACA